MAIWIRKAWLPASCLALITIWLVVADRDPNGPSHRSSRPELYGASARYPLVGKLSDRVPQDSVDGPSSQDNLALQDLLSGHLGPAIDRWQTLADSNQASSDNLNDLAVAYLTRAEVEDDNLDILRALDLLDQANTLTNQPEVLFNHALALSSLHLRSLSTRAWRRFLIADPPSDWVQEAKQRLSTLDSPGREQWSEVEKSLSKAGGIDTAIARQAVKEFPYQTRVFCERTLLHRVAAAAQNRNLETARSWLQTVRPLAEAFADLRQDAFLIDEINRLDESIQSDGASAASDAFGPVLQYLEGLGLQDSRDLESAENLLRSAAIELESLGSPLAHTSQLYAEISGSYRDSTLAKQAIQRIIESTPDRYPDVRGRAFWMLGIIESGQNRFVDAEKSYSQGFELIQVSSGENRAAILELLRADNFDRRGEYARSWRHRNRALGRILSGNDPQRHFSSLLEASQALGRHGWERLALVFLQEAEISLTKYPLPYARAEISLEQATNLLSLGQRGAAGEKLAEARTAIDAMAESSFKERLDSLWKLTDGLTLLDRDPAAAHHQLTVARAFFEDTNFQVVEIDLFLAMAQARKSLGQAEASIGELATAIENLDQVRRNAEQVFEAVDAFRQARNIFDQLIVESLELPGGIAKAFAWVEKSRSQTALGLWLESSNSDTKPPLLLEDVERALPPETTLIEFSSIGDELLVWILETEQTRFVRLEISTLELKKQSERFRTALRVSNEPEIKALGAALYQELISPLGLSLNTRKRLVIVPEGPLTAIPFSALFDPHTDKFVTELTAVSLAPSATLYLLALERASILGEPASVLLVGVPAPPSGPYGGLQALPSVAEEIKGIAAIFPNHLVLLQQDATSSKILESISQFDIFHYSGHAVASAHQWQANALLLTPDVSLDSGILQLGGLFNDLPKAPRLVTLSACETLRGYDGGREGVFSLAMAFFAAGTPTVVGSMWSIDDEMSSRFMQLFYGYLEVNPPAEALRLAKIASLRTSDSASNPQWNWAAFELIGG